jgi:hypothetical protein
LRTSPTMLREHPQVLTLDLLKSQPNGNNFIST